MKNTIKQDKEGIVTIPVDNGVGIFEGPISEQDMQSNYKTLAIIGLILTVIVAWITIKNASEILHYIPSALCSITTIFLILSAIRLKKTPIKPVKTVKVDGIWISEEKIWWGEKTIELEKEHFISDLYSLGINPINLLPEMTIPQNQKTSIDTSKGIVTFQIAHSKNNSKKYKIVFIHISQDGKDLYTQKFLIGNPVLITNGKLYTFNHLRLVDQLKKVADTVKSFGKEEVNPCSLLITSWTQMSIGIPLAAGAIVGGIAQSFTDSKARDNIVNSIAKGDFIDTETGAFLLDLIQNYKWKVGYRPLGDKELGVYDQW